MAYLLCRSFKIGNIVRNTTTTHVNWTRNVSKTVVQKAADPSESSRPRVRLGFASDEWELFG